MKNIIALLTVLIISTSGTISAQAKIISECTVVYDIKVENSQSDAELVKSLNETTKTLYIKGTKSRSELISPKFTQITLTDSKIDTTVILRELGNSRYITYLSGKDRNRQNERFKGMTLTPTTETKTILGYECVKAVARLKDGTAYNIYYAPSVTPSTKEFEHQFEEVPGFLLEYETEIQNGKAKIIYTATKITLTPVPASKFELPTSGYRVYQPQKKS